LLKHFLALFYSKDVLCCFFQLLWLFLFFKKGQMKFGFFGPFLVKYIIYVDLAGFKMILADFWALAHSSQPLFLDTE